MKVVSPPHSHVAWQMLCYAQVRLRTEAGRVSISFVYWNFALDRLASRMYAATATPFLMKLKNVLIFNKKSGWRAPQWWSCWRWSCLTWKTSMTSQRSQRPSMTKTKTDVENYFEHCAGWSSVIAGQLCPRMRLTRFHLATQSSLQCTNQRWCLWGICTVHAKKVRYNYCF